MLTIPGKEQPDVNAIVYGNNKAPGKTVLLICK